MTDWRDNDPAWTRRYPIPTATTLQGEAEVDYGAEIDRCTIIAPNGNVSIGASSLSQCVIVEPCQIGDGVKAVAAILQGVIGDGVEIEAHADIMGTVGDDAIVRMGSRIEHGASIGEGAEVGDRSLIAEGAVVGNNVIIGAQSSVGRQAFIDSLIRLPARSVVRPGAQVLPMSADRRRQLRDDEHYTHFKIVDDEWEEEEEQEEDGEQEEEQHESLAEHRTSEYLPPALSLHPGPGPGGFTAGQPILRLADFQPGTARSWVLSKLGRIANLKSPDGRLTKKLVTQYRPDLLDHAVTKEVLRITPPVTDETLAAMSFDALSPARYDVYENISYHSGATPEWQMIGPQANDVFVLAAPESVIREALGASDPLHSAQWVDNDDDLHELRTLDGAVLGSVSMIEGGSFLAQSDDWEVVERNLRDAKEAVAKFVSDGRRFADAEEVKEAFGVRDTADGTDWHPDRRVAHSVGWIRLVVSPPSQVLLVEVQSDRAWMKFDYRPNVPSGLAEVLRDVYYESFFGDAVNIVVEWAFTNGYREVLVPDYESRKLLGGSPPKSAYDDVPKKYVVGPPVPLKDVSLLAPVYNWVPVNKMKVRRIVPNRVRR